MIAALAALAALWMQWPPPSLKPFPVDEWLRDEFVRVHASSEPESRILVVDIDERSLKQIGPWPWPRARIATLVENLLGPYESKGVALDLVFPERADEDGDQRLAALAQHAPVVLAQAFDYTPAQLLRVGELAGGRPWAGEPAMAATGYIANHPLFREAEHTGNIGFLPDADGMIRRLPITTRFGARAYPTLSRALLECCDGSGAPPAAVATATAAARIPYGRDWNAYTVVPAAAVLDLTAPPEVIGRRLVLVGSSSLGLSDRVATPLSASTSGVLVHAAMLSTLLDEQSREAPSPWPGRWIAALYTILLALLATYTLPRVSALANIGLLCAASAAWLALAFVVSRHDAVFSPAGPLVAAFLLLAVAVPFQWQVVQGRSRSLLQTLRQYVAGAVVDELLRRDLRDPLTPRRLHVTTLIADMQGYTTYVESLSIEAAAELTRDFLGCLTAPVLDHGGTIDKYTGDGLVAFWGAPLPVEDHADRALDAAAAIQQAVRRFSDDRKKAGLPPLRVRIGIESGIAMAGDFGTASRSIYTAVGDSVNTASRLEQIARDQAYDIIVGHGTASSTVRHRLKLLGEFSLRGKEKQVALYTLDTLKEPASEPPSR